MTKTKQTLALVLFLFCWQGAAAQGSITLDTAIQKAYQHFELQRQMSITANVTDENMQRIAANYLPSVDLNALSTYQNTQISIPLAIPIPGFTPPEAPLNLNTALLTVRQWIYDGSKTHYDRMLEEATGRSRLLEIETQRLELKTSVMQQFFAVLLADKHLAIYSAKLSVLEQRLSEVRSAVKNHVLLQSDADLLQAETILLKQIIAEGRYSRKQSLRALEQLTGSPIPDNTTLELPTATISATTEVTGRPDMLLVDSRIGELEARKGAISSQYQPRIGVFADIGVGLPGYDIFDNNPALMAKAGLTVSWHLFDWDYGSAQERSLELSQQLLGLRKQQMVSQISVQTSMQRTAIEKAETLMESDQELLDLYASVSASYASQLANGSITSADYVTQLNKQTTAQTNLELHKLQKLIATMNYNTMLGE